jgi:hypothetical protein
MSNTQRTDGQCQIMQDLRFSRRWLWSKVSSGMLRCVALVRTDVSGEPGASFLRLARIGELGTTHAATSNRRMLRRNTSLGIPSQHTSVARSLTLHLPWGTKASAEHWWEENRTHSMYNIVQEWQLLSTALQTAHTWQTSQSYEEWCLLGCYAVWLL